MDEWKVYLSKLNKEQKSIIIKILDIAQKNVIESEKVMTYGVPGLKFQKKPLIACAAHKNHYGIYFERYDV